MAGPDLKAALKRAAGGAVPAAEPSASPPPAPPNSRRPPARQGTRFVGGHFAPEVARALKALAATEDTTVQALVAEGINAVLTARGKAPIA